MGRRERYGLECWSDGEIYDLDRVELRESGRGGRDRCTRKTSAPERNQKHMHNIVRSARTHTEACTQYILERLYAYTCLCTIHTRAPIRTHIPVHNTY